MPDSAQMRSWLAVMALLFCPVALAADDGLVPLPSLSARATDLTGTLSAEQKATVEDELAGIEGATNAQVVLLLLPTTKPETIEQFGIRLAEAWKIGHKGKDNGVIVIVAKNDRRVRIEVGYGLEGALNDATCQRIISDYVTPRFKSGDYYGGIQAAVVGIRAVINTETPATADAPAPTPDRLDTALDWLDNFGTKHDNLLLALLGVILVGITALRYFLGNLAGSAIVGGVTGVAGYFLTLSFVSSLIAAGVGFLVALVGVDFIWGALLSGGSGGSSGGSGGGGFSGGGGSFGGGGSSGSW